MQEDRKVRVWDSEGTEVTVEVSDIRQEVLAYPGRDDGKTTRQATFVIKGVPAMGKNWRKHEL